MKSFKETICFHREKEQNWSIEDRGVEEGFKNSDDLVYLGYEVEMEVEVREDMKHKVYKINGVDVSDKEIYV
ncbi:MULTISPECIES: hypothetical protein [unclassified Clostridium]|uniref:hypothetical protein n=1 Tax=unclassified Clostridium TaxID=2614128 RepID=UPI0025BCD3A8|nr:MULTISPECIES: hypothetical protein [unclassified Clostridium]